MVVIIFCKYGNNRSRTEHVSEQTILKVKVEWPWRYSSKPKSSHATHLLMLVSICTKYGKKLSRTVEATECTRFSRSRNDLEDIIQGQRSLYTTHPLILVIIYAKYRKNPLRTVDFFSRSKPKFFQKLPKIQISRSQIYVTRDTPSYYNNHLCQI